MFYHLETITFINFFTFINFIFFWLEHKKRKCADVYPEQTETKLRVKVGLYVRVRSVDLVQVQFPPPFSSSQYPSWNHPLLASRPYLHMFTGHGGYKGVYVCIYSRVPESVPKLPAQLLMVVFSLPLGDQNCASHIMRIYPI